MPKERINYIKREDERTQAGEWTEPQFMIHWTKGIDALAQMSVTISREQIEALYKSFGEEESGDSITLYSNNLSRRELNTAVRHLRTARNDVHGVDE